MLQQKTFQANQEGPHAHERSGKNAPKWYLIDAKGQVPGRLASLIAKVLIGKHKPTFTRHADTGDFVVVINCDKVEFTGQKLEQKLYRDYSGYISGLKSTTARDMLVKHPEEVLKRAVWGMLGKSTLARRQLLKLKLYAGTEHPHAAQEPTELPRAALRRSHLDKPTAN